MIKFTARYNLVRRVHAKCDKHPTYNPEKDDGGNGIIAGCDTCWQIHRMYKSKVDLDNAIREFEARTARWKPPSRAINAIQEPVHA
jgi:hypothetical protein